MAVNIEEKRSFPRLKFRANLRYQVRGKPDFTDTVSDDISLGGISFVNSKFMTPANVLMMEINLLSRILRPVAKLAWSEPIPHSNRYRCGTEFIEFDPEEENYLKDFLSMQMGRL
ncbi:MAG: PilZ domain-containing protein [Candidatus Omnitrophica bacterium]|nr:PilZ domain-containing protein [Candidatus Omnitrophota bacterium]